MPARHTIVAHGSLLTRNLRLEAARERLHGRQVMTFEQLAARLAGGFATRIDDESVRIALQKVLPLTELGELDSIKMLPGMVDAATATLHKVWRAGIDVHVIEDDHPRLFSIKQLEQAVLAELPRTMKRPIDLASAAMLRLDSANSLFGAIDVVGITELSTCWRPLLAALAERTHIRWIAGPRSVPAWLADISIEVILSEHCNPTVSAMTASTAYHEAIEAFRWARELLASGAAEPADLAIASTSPEEYDDYFLALRSDSNLDIHFVHGLKVTDTWEGQTAAALADILLRGLTQSRMRRLNAHLVSQPGPFQEFPPGWTRVMPADAPLTKPEAWNRLCNRLTLDDWPDGKDHTAKLREIVTTLLRGVDAAADIGDELLSGRTSAIWRKALLARPPASLDKSLDSLRQDDTLEASVSIAWMPASELAGSPRRFVRLLGLNSARWPRNISEDRLISDHIIPTSQLDPLPINAADRRDFETIVRTTEHQIVLSRSRRDADGRLLGRSNLLDDGFVETYARRNAVPSHATSESDRLLARAPEFAASPQAISSSACWRNWNSREVTPHDGLVRRDHPVVLAILNRTHSASSLCQLLRNPLGYVWQYGMHWSSPESGSEPIVLDALGMGDLVHMILDRALRSLESGTGLNEATDTQIAAAVEQAVRSAANTWETERPVPPTVIWRRTLDDARSLSVTALTLGDKLLTEARSYAEVPFGGARAKTDGDVPWDATSIVEIPGVHFHIAGYIDRLDVAVDGHRAVVRDYKTGRSPKDDIVLNGGKELQRCLYAFAVRALLGSDVQILASLLYLRQQVELPLNDADAALRDVTGYLQSARISLESGKCIPGPDTGIEYDDLAFALPANASASYCKRKLDSANELLGEATRIWEAK